MSSVTAAVVAFNTPEESLEATRESLRSQTAPPRQLLVVDNSPGATSHDDVVASGENLGYGGGANLALELSDSDYVLLSNSDVSLEPTCLQILVAALDDDPNALIAGAQVLLPDGRVNAGANPVHLSGLSWSGRYGQPPEGGPPREVLAVSGAVMLLRRAALLELGGFCAALFLYHEDVEVCLRAKLAGWSVVFCPEARAEHAYEFDRTAAKWKLLERNRWFTLLTALSGRTLLRLAPLLAAVEGAVWVHATLIGSAGAKLASYRELFLLRREIRAWRRSVQRLRRKPDSALIAAMAADVDTPLLRLPCRAAVNRAMRAYKRLVAGSG